MARGMPASGDGSTLSAERLAGGQLADLEATERVLARYSKGSGVSRTASTRTANAAGKAASPSASRRAAAALLPRNQLAAERSSPSLNDQVLALADGQRRSLRSGGSTKTSATFRCAQPGE